MVDWKKDIKLSDLLARKKDDDVEAAEAPHSELEPEVVAQEIQPGEAASEEPVTDELDAGEEPARPFWKRELTFGRRNERGDEAEAEADAGADEDVEKRSFFKRELGFSRSEEPAPETDAPDPEADVDQPEAEEAGTPFWRKGGATFGRRKDDDVRDPDFDTPEEPGRPFWKRELSFGRRKDDVWPDAPEAVAEGAADEMVETEEREARPFWKREVSFGRPRHAAEDAPADAVGAADEESPAPFVDEDEKPPFWKRELTFGRGRDDAADDALQETVHQQHPEPEGELVAPAAEEAPKRSELAFHEEPHPPHPVTPDQEPVEEDEPEATPFWKRELKLGRQRQEVDFEEEVDAAPEGADKRSFFKRELTFGRRRNDARHEADAGTVGPLGEESTASFAAAEEEARVPFWKRRLSFGRGEDPDFDTAPAETEKRPFFKRELSFPGFGPRGKSAATASDATADKPSFIERLRRRRVAREAEFEAPTQIEERKPFFKREFSFRRGSRGTHEPVGAAPAKGGRRKQMVGLKVGASQIAAARVVNNGSPELVQLARQSIEHGIVVGGELRDPDALAEALREFFARHKLPNRNVRLGIGNNRIGVRSFEISGVHDPKQLENAVRFRAQEALPIPLDEAVLDYHVIDEATSPTGIRTYRVLLVVAYRELIDRYVAACRGAGLRLVGIDLEAFALLRALTPPPSEVFPEDTALVAVSIGHDRSTFAVSNGTVCEFTRVLDWGGASLNVAIARALDVTPSQAEPVKRTLALSGGEEGAGPSNNEHAARAEEAVRLELQSFARELVSSLHFYQNQPGSLAIGAIVLTGGTAHLPGLAAELQRLIGVKVRVGDPLRRMKVANRVEAPDQLGSMAIAIGLGIED